MITSSMQTRRLTTDDFEAFKQMDTGITDDYILRIFPHSVEREATYGTFMDGQLVCIAAYTLFAGHYAVLGRLRTDRRFRGQGLATKLLSELCRMIDREESVVWIGLATELSNTTVHCIAHKLGMERLSAFDSCILTDEGREALKNQPDQGEWLLVTDLEEKRMLLQSVSAEENRLHIFPYECYYPLPYEKALWTDEYLSGCDFWKCGDRFVVLMEDEKGEAYLHVKYFWDDVFAVTGLWPKVIDEARKSGRRIWIDLPYPDGLPEKTASFFRHRTWTCYGRKNPQIG